MTAYARRAKPARSNRGWRVPTIQPKMRRCSKIFSIRATADSRTRAEYAEVATAIRRSRRVSWYRRAGYAAAAAVVALFVAVASFDAAEQSVPTEIAAPEMLQAYAPCGESLEVALPDGSVIVLAADSRLTYPASFDGDTRHVELVGECFASIAKNPAKPFILTSGKVDVVVKGTQFNVKSRRSSSEVEVALVEGSVLVENRINEEERILLEPAMFTTKPMLYGFDPGVPAGPQCALPTCIVW